MRTHSFTIAANGAIATIDVVGAAQELLLAPTASQRKVERIEAPCRFHTGRQGAARGLVVQRSLRRGLRVRFLSANDSLWVDGGSRLASSDTETLGCLDSPVTCDKGSRQLRLRLSGHRFQDRMGALLGVDERATGESFAALWQELDSERQARGWTRDRLARRTSQLSQQPYAEKTLHDRMAQGRRVSWDQVMWVVRALDLDEQSWKQRWEQANKTRHRDRSSPQPMAESSTTLSGSDTTAYAFTPMTSSLARSAPSPSPFWRSRFAGAVFGFVAGATVTLMTVWAMNWLTDERSQPTVCALVNPSAADVFLTPSDPKPMFAKQRGERIRLPANMPPTVTDNGDRYRVVHTNRAPSGYAYMREDALTPSPC
jgi:hypothetical protein